MPSEKWRSGSWRRFPNWTRGPNTASTTDSDLDLSQLPRPFQIGAIGEADWDLSVGASLAWQLPVTK